jgi:hypothetical protein
MPRRLASVLALASALLLVAAPPGTAAGHRSKATTFVDSLNASPATVFDDAALGAYLPIWAEQSLGPQFTVTRPTVLAQVGAFANAYASNYPTEGRPFRVEIRRADADGLPADGAPLAVADLTDDHDASTWRYESAAFRVRLRPGTYFALVSADSPPLNDPPFPGGVLTSTNEGGEVSYLADDVQLGVRDPVAGTEQLTTGRAAFRVIGCVRAGHRHGTTHHGRTCSRHRLG